MNKAELFQYILKAYGISPDYPFSGDPETAVFRHPDNRKWFAVVMHIPKAKLGLRDDTVVPIVNVKCDPHVAYSFKGQQGIYPAYHMNRNHWLTVSLEGDVDAETVTFLLGVSHTLTKKKPLRKGKTQ